ncbi:hypothetical protein GH714_035215 [Hevea brasiliensis]|uniref:TAFII28-like protein domain-containing protein n=1 Tax=Hevea brasiliensis TaxID=3981 RepID=A0A6A6LT33_HEVBR|nr:hypothetical protein GH714_035215 [Hevea brasiliensis]
MKQSKDPFEAAYEEQEETPPDSPVGPDELDTQAPAASQDPSVVPEDDDIGSSGVHPADPSTSTPVLAAARSKPKNKDDEDDEEEDNMEVELSKFPSSADPDKMAKMQAILSQFTDEQMSRYESFRRSALQKANMRRGMVTMLEESDFDPCDSVNMCEMGASNFDILDGECVDSHDSKDTDDDDYVVDALDGAFGFEAIRRKNEGGLDKVFVINQEY